MGLFSKPIVDCNVCGKKIDSKEKRWALGDGGYICPDCQKPFGGIVAQRAFISFSTEQMKELIEFQNEQNKLLTINKDLYNSLNITKVIENVIYLDELKKKWYYKLTTNSFETYLTDSAYPIVFDYEDVLEIYIAKGDKVISGTSVTRKDKGIRKALMGGLIAGAPGAVLGGMLAQSHTKTTLNELQTYYVNVVISGVDEPLAFPFSNEQSAEKVRLVFTSMIEKTGQLSNSSNNESDNAKNSSSAEEIRKFKQLLDDGIITEEEFEQKKKQLLGI